MLWELCSQAAADMWSPLPLHTMPVVFTQPECASMKLCVLKKNERKEIKILPIYVLFVIVMPELGFRSTPKCLLTYI